MRASATSLRQPTRNSSLTLGFNDGQKDNSHLSLRIFMEQKILRAEEGTDEHEWVHVIRGNTLCPLEAQSPSSQEYFQAKKLRSKQSLNKKPPNDLKIQASLLKISTKCPHTSRYFDGSQLSRSLWSLKCWSPQSSCIWSKGLRLWSGINVTPQVHREDTGRERSRDNGRNIDSCKEKTPLLPIHIYGELRGKKMMVSLVKGRISLNKRKQHTTILRL